MQNFMKTILSGVQTWTKGKIKESVADWNQNDSSADNYVKNRTHWEEEENVSVLNETTVTITDECDECYEFGTIPYGQLIAGQTYYVTLNGVEYKCVARYYDEYECVLIGNGTIYGDGNASNNEPFSCDSYDDGNIYLNAAVGEYTISISDVKTVVHKLDHKYLDLPTNLATTDDVQEAVDAANEAQSAANEAQSAANEAQSAANGKMDKNNPVGTGSFSMNRKTGTVVGNYSHAEGRDTAASGHCSHAEGQNTTAFGNSSHAEGSSTAASGVASHAEGYSTKAENKAQHVQGEFNILDTEGTETTRGKYAHIVGNGTAYNMRSNAHTLDWNGIGWFQGGLQVGGNAQDDGAKNVLLEGDAVPVPESATVGQTIAVKSVDENGKPVEWECIDATDNGNFGYVVQDTAPEDISVLWVDTADDSDEGLQEVVNIVLAQAKESGVFDGDPGRTPEKGVDYYTEEDKIEMVNAVISALPTWTGGSY